MEKRQIFKVNVAEEGNGDDVSRQQPQQARILSFHEVIGPILTGFIAFSWNINFCYFNTSINNSFISESTFWPFTSVRSTWTRKQKHLF